MSVCPHPLKKEKCWKNVRVTVHVCVCDNPVSAQTESCQAALAERRSPTAQPLNLSRQSSVDCGPAEREGASEQRSGLWAMGWDCRGESVELRGVGDVINRAVI